MTKLEDIMQKKYLTLKNDLLKILSDNLSKIKNRRDINGLETQKNLNGIVDLILKKCISTHKKQHIFNYDNTSSKEDIVHFIFKEPINCIKCFFQAMFGNTLVFIKQFQKKELHINLLVKEILRTLAKVVMSGFIISILYIFALDSASPAISILMIVLALGFISRNYLRN
jgi:hypothetical protein